MGPPASVKSLSLTPHCYLQPKRGGGGVRKEEGGRFFAHLPGPPNGIGPAPGCPPKNGASCGWNGGPPYPKSNLPSAAKYGKPGSSSPPGDRFIGKPRIFRAPPKNGPRPMLVSCFSRRSLERLF
uniref:Uncharacterized protein n=1 Tax=Anopheles merus TaxID=30066 RepID=A0A182V2D7_ANOME